MRNVKKVIAIMLCMSFGLFIFGCGSQTQSSALNSSNQESASSQNQAPATESGVIASNVNMYFEPAEEGWYWIYLDMNLQNNTEKTFTNGAVLNMEFYASDITKGEDITQKFAIPENINPGEEYNLSRLAGVVMDSSEIEAWGTIQSVSLTDGNNNNHTLVKGFPEGVDSESLVAAAKATI